jgi:hypothetical protein
MPEDTNKQKPTVGNDNHEQNVGQRGTQRGTPSEGKDKPTISNDNHDENVGQRGEVVRSAGNKVHGDKLEGMIPSGSEAERANGRPTRDDGDNDDEGELK